MTSSSIQIKAYKGCGLAASVVRGSGVRKQGLTEVNLNNKKLYECDITRAQFEKILPILESAKNKTRPRTTDLYLVFCGILYLLKTGCQWRLIPKEYPDWKLLHYYFTIWNKTEVLSKVLKKISWRGPTKQWSQAHKN